MKQPTARTPFGYLPNVLSGTLCRTFCLWAVAICLSFSQPVAALAQTGMRAPLAPAAQEAVDKGILAAELPDYLLAVRYFEDARKIAPDSPIIYLNLGVAESKIPSRELRAIAWLGAYLAALPNAPNSAAVKQQISVLDVRNQSNVSHLVKTVQAAAGQNPEPVYRYRNLAKVAGLWARIGDDAAAFAAIDLIAGEPLNQSANEKDNGRQAIAWGQMDRDIPRALRTADLIEDVERRARIQTSAAVQQAKANDISGALQTINLVQSPYRKALALRDVAAAQMQSGNLAEALKTLLVARKTALVTPDADNSPGSIAFALERIALTQIEAGDAIGGRDTLASSVAFAFRDVGTISDPTAKRRALNTISKNQAAIGDISSAQKTLASADFGFTDDQINAEKSEVLCAITTAQISAGDIAGATRTLELARKTLDLIQDAGLKNLYSCLKTAQAALGDPTQQAWRPPAPAPRQTAIGVSDWLRLLDRKLIETDLNTEPFLDLAGYLKSLPPSENPQKTFDQLIALASRIITAQSEVNRMLAQQSHQ